MPRILPPSSIWHAQMVGQINDKTTRLLMKDIDAATVHPKMKRIRITLTSGGGFLYYAFALYNHIHSSRLPVDIVASGFCMSAAVMVMQAATKRIAYENTLFMVHPSHNSVDAEKSYDEFMAIVESYKTTHDLFVKLTIERAGISRKKFESIYSPRKYLTANEALKLGLIDEIIVQG